MNTNDNVTILTGRARTGKTKELLRRISENERHSIPSLVIVPSQSTFEYEKMLASCCGGGFMHTTVTGFFRLGEKVLEERGLRNSFINPQGRVMMIRHSIERSDLGIFRTTAGKPGFAVMCDEIISNFVTCELSPADVYDAAQVLPEDSLLREKLLDLAQIYRLTDEYLSETGQVLRAASETICELLPESPMCNSNIFIDGIENPGKQTYEMIAAMIPVAKSMTIAIGADLTADSTVFQRENDIYARVHSVIKEAGFSPRHIHLTGESRYSHKVFDHIESELWNTPARVFSGDSSHVELACASSLRSEVDMLCAAIQSKAKSGVRYRRMAVVASDPAKYDTMVKSRFSELHIPLFHDNRLRLSATAPAALIKSALDCITKGYTANDIISLMKTGLAGINREEAELFENYLIESGASGSDLTQPFTGDMSASFEDTRAALITPLRELQSAFARGSVREKVNALRAYLDKLDLKAQLDELSDELTKTGNTVEAKQYSRIYELMCGMLDQLCIVLGQNKISTDDLSDIILEGLTADIVGIIPSGIDMVSYSGTVSMLPPGVDHVFIIGANDSSFPAERSDAGIIDDTELEQIKSTGTDVWLSVASSRLYDEEKIYKTITSADEFLYMSYYTVVSESVSGPAPVFRRLQRMLNKPVISDLSEDCRYKLRTLDSFAAALRTLADKKALDASDRAFVSWFLRSKEHERECSTLTDAVFFDPTPNALDPELAKTLFHEKIYGSVSNIESYYACPFSYLMKYTLRAGERRVYTAASVDIGSFCHDVLDRFAAFIIDNKLDLRKIPDEQCKDIASGCVQQAVAEYRNGLFARSGKMRGERNYLSVIVTKTIQAIVRQIRMGSFNIAASEVRFGTGPNDTFPPIRILLSNGTQLILSGKIDRMDSYDDGTCHVQIVDYKTGDKSFSLHELYNGLQLQLPIYLEALCAASNYDGCGMYYMTVTDHKASGSSEQQIRMELDRQYRMKGLILSDACIIKAVTGGKTFDKTSAVVAQSTLVKGVSNCLPREKIQSIRRFALKKAMDAAEDIISGKFPAQPYKQGQKTPCEYCDYKSVCMFDESILSCRYRTLPAPDINEIFADTEE